MEAITSSFLISTMFKDKKILCVIPARGGSKRLPGKNIKLLEGKPLIAYAIAAAKASKYIDRVVVSTDDEAIARVAKECGAEVPFMRPPELAGDLSPVVPALQHAVTYMQDHESFRPDVHVLIQSTTPFVTTEDIDLAIETFFATESHSCVSVCEISERPEWMYTLEGAQAVPFIDTPAQRGQDLQKLFRLNGAVYVTKIEVLMEKNMVFDNANCSAVIMPRDRSVDIDTIEDFMIAEAQGTRPSKESN